ncbi:hypothetical protein BKA66DRAFT_564805 [Pyrenochaeta sp. MPI-SDFR-AT-0127]|nr:hypothetical protein BKA66DRAFT_564805 [Pyrenochaeta sp. MPI-SDFR-AT-0127]
MGHPEPIAAVTNVTQSFEPKDAPSRRSRNTRPWATLLAIFCILGSSVGAAIVVRVSDGKPTTSWKTRPSVVLAVLAPVMTLSFAYLLSTAICLAWWRAAESGTTIEHLNRIWDRGFWLRRSTWKSSVFGTRGFKRLALASLLIPIGSFLYNPLFQLSTRASRTGAEADTIPLSLDILPMIPDGLAATTFTGRNARFDFSAAAVQWYRQDSIHTKDREGYRCAGICRGVIHAPGISASCSNETSAVDLTSSRKTELWFFDVSLNLTRHTDNYLQVTLQSLYTTTTTKDCVATQVTETCQIQIARSAYNIVIEDTKVTVLPRRLSEWTSENVLRTEPHDSPSLARPGPLFALPYMGTYFTSYSGWDVNSTALSTYGVLSEVLFKYTEQGGENCRWDYRWTSPTEYILNAMGEVLFRLAMNGNSVTNLTVSGPPESVIPQRQAFQAQRTHQVIFYKSDYQWLGIALGIVFLSLVALSTILFGQGVPRDVSLSPVETLQVFPPGMVQAVDMQSNSSAGHRAEDIIAHVGDMKVNFKPDYSLVAIGETAA